ncbi:hypothetical protein GOBAR_AA06918 [Gossypium barbadense]|uniref:Reverse transcriptase zinc-binding domain-containing protein n=1 Tax=Gossypium barbadense TaxID=3634 RepID=A0A2P5YDH4_GOSBA|nr:hypothetical protein GOBAR_AA06918 [Gossypium barbadense]
MLSCPLKIRITLWKFLKHFVPTKSSLYNKRIANDPLCLRCYQAVDDVNHILRYYDFARGVRLALHYVSPGNNEQIDFHEWLSWMFENHSANKRAEIVVVLWVIWYARNKRIHEGTNQRVGDLVAFVRGYCIDVEMLVASIYRSSPPQAVCWSAPLISFVEINVDAGFSLTQ